MPVSTMNESREPHTRVALVGCSKRKLRLSPGQKVPARELYSASHLFRLQLAAAQERFEHVFIFSAEHGLVGLEEPLATYEKSMRALSREDRLLLARGVVGALLSRFSSALLDLEVYAGAVYVEPLRHVLPAGWSLVEPLAGLTLFQRRSALRHQPPGEQCVKRPAGAPEAEAREHAASEKPGLSRPTCLQLPALRIRQSAQGPEAYSFAVDGKLVHRFATVSRVRRVEGKITGYQRPEALAHVDNIRRYLESERAMVPNAVVLAFDGRVKFEPGPAPAPEGRAAPSHVLAGHLVIPLPEEGAEEHTFPGFIVDGQQRLAAVREAQLESFPLFCSAFITDSQAEQAEQFLRVNSVKPVAKGLIYELLPATSATLPPALEARKLPAALVERLNAEEESPLKGLIKTVTNPHGVATDTAFLNALELSLRDGVLNGYRSGKGADTEGMCRWLRAWWGAVREVFPGDWGKKPKESRLFHGAGVVSLSLLMDAVADRLQRLSLMEPTREQLAQELAYVSEVCAWSSGMWDFGAMQKREWNAVQNTRQDVERLSRLLVLTYRERSKGRPVQSVAAGEHAKKAKSGKGSRRRHGET